MNTPTIIFFGNTKYSVIGAEIINKAFPISLVVTIPDREKGRKKVLTPSPTKSWAQSAGIPILETDKISSTDLQEIGEKGPDFLIVEDYGLILPEELLIMPKFAPLNIHHSLLPKYRGPSPAPTAILNGDAVSGVTIIRMTKEVDAGDILNQESYNLTPEETTDSLLKKLNQLGGELVTRGINGYLEGTAKPKPQDQDQASYTKRIKKSDGFFDLPAGRQESPEFKGQLDRMVRAYYPWPNAWTTWSPSRHPESAEGEMKDLKTVKLYPGGKIQIEGKNIVSIEEFMRGYPDFPLKELV